MDEVEVRVSRPIPAKVVSRKLLAFFNRSLRPVPSDLRAFGFSRIEFSNHQYRTWITLHLARTGEPNERVPAKSINLAAVQRRPTEPRPELTVFDTAQGRIGAKRIVRSSSLDDPASAAAKVLQLAPGLAKLGGTVAGVPALGRALATALPRAVEASRQAHGTSADQDIRIAKLDNEIGPDTRCSVGQGRNDRVFDPPARLGGAWAPDQWQYVLEMLDRVRQDLMECLDQFVTEHGAAGRPAATRRLVRLHVEASWAKLFRRSLDAFDDGYSWPLPLRLLGFDDGPRQYVHHVGSGYPL